MATEGELARRIGFAKGQIEEALGLLDNRSGSLRDGRYYWTYKALVRARDELAGETVGGRAAPC